MKRLALAAIGLVLEVAAAGGHNVLRSRDAIITSAAAARGGGLTAGGS